MRNSVLVILLLSILAVTALADPPPKPDAAAEYFAQVSKLASQGDTASQVCLGKLYVMGYGTDLNEQKALYWYQSAAEHGDLLGQVQIADAYAWGIGGQRDTKKAVGMLNELVAKDYAPAAAELGILYTTGNGVTKDPGEAFKLYEKAADAGDVDGEIELGMAYHEGRGVKVDDSKSGAWMQKVVGHKFQCAAMYLRALPGIISTYLSLPHKNQGPSGTLGITFTFKEGRATDIFLLKSSGNQAMDAAWLKATEDAKLPPWPDSYHTDDMTETFWVRV